MIYSNVMECCAIRKFRNPPRAVAGWRTVLRPSENVFMKYNLQPNGKSNSMTLLKNTTAGMNHFAAPHPFIVVPERRTPLRTHTHNCDRLMDDAFRSTYKFYVIKHRIRNKGMEGKTLCLVTSAIPSTHTHARLSHQPVTATTHIDFVSLRIYGWAIWFHVVRARRNKEQKTV